MTSIFTKVKPGDLITSDLFNQITGKIEEMDEITSVMEIKKSSEANASEPGKLSVKANLGIGTKELPSEKLEVNGTVKTGNDSQFLVLKGLKRSEENPKNSMTLDFTTSSQGRTSPSIPTASFRAIDDDTNSSSHLGFFTNEIIQDQNKLTERLRITSNGNVGIGTSTPSSKLEVNGTVTANRFVGDGSGLTGITGGKAGQWTDIEGGISYNSGNIGIGTDKPLAKLEVNGNIKASSIESKPAVHEFKVEGKLEEFYPIIFEDGNWIDGPMVLEINRPNIDTDSDQRGSLISKFTIHSTNGKNGADVCHAEIYENQDINKEFIAGYKNIPDSTNFVVWLRGGNTTYSFRSNHFVTLDSSAKAKTFNNEPYLLKTNVESYVVKNCIHFDKDLVIDGNVGIGITALSEKLEVKGTVKADKFLGDGSGLTGLKEGQWANVEGGISYDKGNVGIGTASPVNKLDVFGDAYFGTGKNNENHKIVIRGPNQPGGPDSFQDLSYEFATAGSVKIRAYRGGWWDTYLQFLTTPGSDKGDNPQVRMHINGDGNVGIGTTKPEATLQVGLGPASLAIGPAVGADLGYGTSYIGFNAVKTDAGWKFETDTSNNGGGVIYSTIAGELNFANISTNSPAAFQMLTNEQIYKEIKLSIKPNGDIKISGKIIQEEWQPMSPLLSGWREYGEGYNPPGYFLDKSGIVHLRGLVKDGKITGGHPNDDHIFILPEGYRPANRELHIVASIGPRQPYTKSENGFGRCDITIEGKVVAVDGNEKWFSLDGITFRAK